MAGMCGKYEVATASPRCGHATVPVAIYSVDINRTANQSSRKADEMLKAIFTAANEFGYSQDRGDYMEGLFN